MSISKSAIATAIVTSIDSARATATGKTSLNASFRSVFDSLSSASDTMRDDCEQAAHYLSEVVKGLGYVDGAPVTQAQGRGSKDKPATGNAEQIAAFNAVEAFRKCYADFYKADFAGFIKVEKQADKVVAVVWLDAENLTAEQQAELLAPLSKQATNAATKELKKAESKGDEKAESKSDAEAQANADAITVDAKQTAGMVLVDLYRESPERLAQWLVNELQNVAKVADIAKVSRAMNKHAKELEKLASDDAPTSGAEKPANPVLSEQDAQALAQA